ncbi:uncharacterized protein DS421_9g268530 [Arachis hypogaea]|nr:uncharacterized protein DS421_9g268530 [Arachis hypogaea]
MREKGSSQGRKKTLPVPPALSCLISTIAVEGLSPWPWRGAAVHACLHKKKSCCSYRRLLVENTPSCLWSPESRTRENGAASPVAAVSFFYCD